MYLYKNTNKELPTKETKEDEQIGDLHYISTNIVQKSLNLTEFCKKMLTRK